jgi:hypothetical protein
MAKAIDNLKASDLGFGSLRNGTTVWDRSRERNRDYLTVAHISVERVITYRQPVSSEQRAAIEAFAATADPNVSATQDKKVFIDRP